MPVITKQFQNLTLPQLGFGSMRLPLLPNGGDEAVDQAAVDNTVHREAVTLDGPEAIDGGSF